MNLNLNLKLNKYFKINSRLKVYKYEFEFIQIFDSSHFYIVYDSTIYNYFLNI